MYAGESVWFLGAIYCNVDCNTTISVRVVGYPAVAERVTLEHAAAVFRAIKQCMWYVACVVSLRRLACVVLLGCGSRTDILT